MIKNRQTYYNIATGVTIAIMSALIIGAWGWVAKMQATINKADLALREIERNNADLKNTNTILHRRINEVRDKIDCTNELTTRVDERSRMNREDTRDLIKFINSILLSR